MMVAAPPKAPAFLPRLLLGMAAMLCLGGSYLLVSGRAPVVGIALLGAGATDALIAFVVARRG
jgi:hypothetical protein